MSRSSDAPAVKDAVKAVDAPALPKPDTTATADEYARIETGMAYWDVVEIIGFAGEEVSSVEIGPHRTVMVSWRNWNGSNMIVTFQNGGVVAKAQFGLR